MNSPFTNIITANPIVTQFVDRSFLDKQNNDTQILVYISNSITEKNWKSQDKRHMVMKSD